MKRTKVSKPKKTGVKASGGGDTNENGPAEETLQITNNTEPDLALKSQENGDGDAKIEVNQGATTSRLGRKSKPSNDKDKDPEESYEVEKIIDTRLQFKKRQYKVRWLNYTETDDTWEFEADLNCQDLIDAYLNENPINKKSVPAKRKTDKPAPPSSSRPKRAKSDVKESKESTQVTKKKAEVKPTKPTDYEVEKIIKMRKSKGTNEFLIRWKGYNSNEDTWEPEGNLSCPDLIQDFVAKEKSSPSTETKKTPKSKKSGLKKGKKTGGRKW